MPLLTAVPTNTLVAKEILASNTLAYIGIDLGAPLAVNTGGLDKIGAIDNIAFAVCQVYIIAFEGALLVMDIATGFRTRLLCTTTLPLLVRLCCATIFTALLFTKPLLLNTRPAITLNSDKYAIEIYFLN